MRVVQVTSFIIVFFLIACANLYAQKTSVLDSIATIEALDSLLIDRNPKNYSLRLFGNFKTQNFNFASDENKVTYKPKNNFGVGFGFANKKLLIDIAFNIKSSKEERTKRFNLNFSYKLKKNHYFDVFIQRYKGFTVEDKKGRLNEEFRKDIRSFTSGLNYLYLINEDNYDTGTLRNVIDNVGETDFSFGLGGFALVLDQQGDQSVLKEDQGLDENLKEIKNLTGFGLGILAGAGGFFAMDKHLYSSLSLNAGAGLMHKNVNHSHDNAYEDPMVYQLSFSAVLGYVTDTYYFNLSAEMGYYSTEMIKDINENVSMAQAKLAFGYKILKYKKAK